MTQKPSKKPLVFLYIGIKKAGSTALQAWLHSQIEQLLKTIGVFYPEEDLKGIAYYSLSDILGFKYGKTRINDKAESPFSIFPPKGRQAITRKHDGQYQYIADHYLGSRQSGLKIFLENQPKFTDKWDTFILPETGDTLTPTFKASHL